MPEATRDDRPIRVAERFRLDGKRVLITGAGRGLGAACAEALAEAGAHVVLMSRSAEPLDAMAAKIATAGGSAETVVQDVTDIEATMASIDTLGPLDGLVNNAGSNQPEPFIEVAVDTYDRLFGVNVRACFFAAQAAAKGMIAGGVKGSIVNMSSQMGHVGAPNRTVYCASKHAMEGLTKAMAWDLGSSGIRVNTVCPTFVETPLTRPFFEDPAFKADTLSRIALGGLGQLEDVAAAVLYLIAPASGTTTGSAVMVDGGWTAR
ncbi:MAG: SDR family oxidoreductase [Alphaproteobacteria bacterium]|nr:SDR family oxidoreductase [Alphaproteobacteria bacterium]